MGSYHITMQFDIAAEPKSVLDALRSSTGIASWWSTAVEGDPGTLGGRFGVSFPDQPQPFDLRVTRADDNRVEWRVGDFPPWWLGTTIRWDVADNPDAEGTRLLFSHRDYEPDNPVIPIVTPAWAQIILRLKSFAETGRPDPFFPGSERER